MKSKISFSNLLVIQLRNHVWSIALSCITFFLTLPILSALYASIIKQRYAMGWINKRTLLGSFRAKVYGEGNGFLMLAICVLAVIIAMNGFAFLFSKQKVDLYHSMPISRTKLFFSNYLAGFLTFVVPYILFLLISYVVSAANGMFNLTCVYASLVMLFINILGFLCVYSVTVIGIMLTGSLPVACLAVAVLLGFNNLILFIIYECKRRFFITYMYWNDGRYHQYLSPVAGYFGLTTGMKSFGGVFRLSVARILVFSLFTILFIVIGLLLYKIRPSEATGKSIAFKKTIPYISVLMLVPIAILGGIGFENLAGTSDNRVNYGWMIAGALIAIVIGHFVIQAIYYRDFRSMFKNLVNPLVAGIISALIFSVFAFDLFGYNTYLPKENKFESAAFNGYEFQSYMEYYNFNPEEDKDGNKDVWVNTEDYRFDHMAVTDYSLIQDLYNACLEDSVEYDKLNRSINYNDSIDADYAFQNTNYNELNKYKNIAVKYKLKNGHEVYRTYYLNIEKNLDLYMRLMASEEYKKGVFDILNLKQDEIENIRFADSMGDSDIVLDSTQQKQLVEAYREDLLSQDPYETKDILPVGYIYKAVDYRENNYTVNYQVAKSYIYPSFTKTLSLLSLWGMTPGNRLVADAVKCITVSNYHYNDDAVEGSVSETDTKEYTDKKDIAKILDCIVPGEMLNGGYSLFHEAEMLDVYITFNSETDNQKGLYYLFPAGSVPDFVAKDVNY